MIICLILVIINGCLRREVGDRPAWRAWPWPAATWARPGLAPGRCWPRNRASGSLSPGDTGRECTRSWWWSPTAWAAPLFRRKNCWILILENSSMLCHPADHTVTRPNTSSNKPSSMHLHIMPTFNKYHCKIFFIEELDIDFSDGVLDKLRVPVEQRARRRLVEHQQTGWRRQHRELQVTILWVYKKSFFMFSPQVWDEKMQPEVTLITNQRDTK